ncbi:hypothetical protein [Poseidonocella sp. HB161398]|uniref:hypothetical protein n=1 Tax=Poseidonocella sp. HB161398 TaxID=2320855 RepID=UPI001108112C|nr:hypothetical protein [Poseidonocella sp. HB161398]
MRGRSLIIDSDIDSDEDDDMPKATLIRSDEDLFDISPGTTAEDRDFARELAPIVRMLEAWGKTTLSAPAATHGGISPCPFAAQAMASGSTRVYRATSLGLIPDLIATDPPLDDECYLIAIPLDLFTFEDIIGTLTLCRRNHFGIWTDIYHPSAKRCADIPGIQALADLGICIIKLTRMADIQASAERIAKTCPGYYPEAHKRRTRVAARAALLRAFAPAMASGFEALNDAALTAYSDDEMM